MTSFGSTNLDSLGQVDITGTYRTPSRSFSTMETRAPGIAGSQLLIGGEDPQAFTLDIWLEGSGGSQSAAQAAVAAHRVTLDGLLKETEDLVDPNGDTVSNSTLIGYVPGPMRYSGSSTVKASQLVTLVFRRTFGESG